MESTQTLEKQITKDPQNSNAKYSSDQLRVYYKIFHKLDEKV